MIKLPGGASLAEVAERLEDAGLDILIDDRDFSSGVKFAEAGWVGAPVVIVSGRKSAERGGVEVRSPADGKRIIPLEGAAAAVFAILREVM